MDPSFFAAPSVLGRRALALAYVWLAGNDGMEKKMETSIMDYLGITMRIHSIIPS